MPTTAVAQPTLTRLRAEAAELGAQTPDPYFRDRLSKAIRYTEDAAGHVRCPLRIDQAAARRIPLGPA